MGFREITCQIACNRIKGRMPYQWDLNVYRGCTHGCHYCFAQYSHDYLGGDYFHDVYVKTNIVERLEKQLRQSSWKKEIINLGGVTDNYQPAEKIYQLMPEIWKILIHYKNPVIVSTKSDLILRDFDLIDELARYTYVNVASTITSVDEAIRQKLEPGGAPYQKRFQMLQAFSKTNASTGLHVMPVIPLLTDSMEGLFQLFMAGKEAGVKYVLPQPLNLRGRTRQHFFSFLEKEYPQLTVPLLKLYQTGYLQKDYRKMLADNINTVARQAGISRNYMSLIQQRLKQPDYTQLSLFDK